MLFVSAQGQEQTSTSVTPVSKSGIPILPAAGDIAIGADALPYLNYLGNIFNNTSNNTLNLGSQSLYFRYYLSENTALRAILKISSGLNIQKMYVDDDAAVFADPLSQAKLEDKRSISTNGYNLNLAYQISRGYGRLRGFYGVQVNYGLDRQKDTYAYGNNITVANPSPSNAFGMGATRTLEIDFGMNQTVGAGLLAGVEYYFLPKICIGGEVGLNYTFSWGSQSNRTFEQLIGSKVETRDVLNAPGNKTHLLGTIRPANYGGLYLLFHF